MTVATDVVDEIEAATLALRGVWDEVLVDEFDHALQAAGQAELVRPGDDEFVVAALLHDIAHSPPVARTARDLPHERLAQEWLKPRLGERVAWLAGAHVAAKRALASDPGYVSTLSEVSVASLVRQGGVALDENRATHRWWPDALLLRRCDEAAKTPGAQTPAWAPLRAAIVRVAAGSARREGRAL